MGVTEAMTVLAYLTREIFPSILRTAPNVLTYPNAVPTDQLRGKLFDAVPDLCIFLFRNDSCSGCLAARSPRGRS